MKISLKILPVLIFINFILACKRSEFLDKKPRTDILTPKTLNDFQALLENFTIMNATGITLPQLSSDEFTIPSFANWQALTAVPRNSYVWASDIHEGETGQFDWDNVYRQIFYANNVIEGLANSEDAKTAQGELLRGWALFSRAYGFYDLIRNYCKAYDVNTAKMDLGIPLRLKPGIDQVEERSTLQQSIDQVLNDLYTAGQLLPSSLPLANLNRPSKIAVYALLSRIFLDMRDYTKAEEYSDKCLALHSSLTNYNTISKTSATPFSASHPELIFITSSSVAYANVLGSAASSIARIDQNLINLYDPNDLRLLIYFTKQADLSYIKKRGYAGALLFNYPFFGLATDEVYLIKAECLARRGDVESAMIKLNQLLINRFTPTNFVPATSSTPAEALATILLERRKELVFRSMRWFDLKRLNKEGADITLSRTLNGQTYVLPPNDNRWVFPIYPEEISISGIQQNPR